MIKLCAADCQLAWVHSSLSPSRQPFLYLVVALASGILLDRCTEGRLWTAGLIALISLPLSVRFVMARRDRPATVALLVSFGAMGALLSLSERRAVDHSRLKLLFAAQTLTASDPVRLTGKLLTPPEPAPGAYYLDLEAESVDKGGEIIQATGRARLMLALIDGRAEEEFSSLGLGYGSQVRVLVRLERARNYNNPGSPDFNEFLESRGYDLKGVIKSPLLIESTGVASANPALSSLYSLRLSAMKAVDARFESRVAGTLKAMLFDNRYFLDKQVAARLREGATFHVLSISGMHVAVIAWVLLGRWSRSRRRGLARVMFSLAAFWSYAVMVGLAPPVTRATLMITVGLIGPLLFKRAASINTVSMAAFIMFSLRPSLIADLSFQLSFMAAAAIVTIALPVADKLRSVGEWRVTGQTPHPPACPRAVRALAEVLFWDQRGFDNEMRRSHVKYRLDKARAARFASRMRIQGVLRAATLLVITSAAIQIATLPLMALYFNRVSPVGIVLNLTAGLLTAVIMLAGLAAIAAGAVSAWIAAQIGWLSISAHQLLVNSIAPLTAIPGATFRVAHYEGRTALIYAAYFLPLTSLAFLIDMWRPVNKRPEAATARTLSSAGRRAALSLACVVALLAAITLVCLPVARLPGGRLTIYFLDVGQGDSALVVFPGGTTMLIDAGGEVRFDNSYSSVRDDERQSDEGAYRDAGWSVGEAVVSRFLWSLGLTQIDYVLATHADADHMSGLLDVIENFTVGQAIIGHFPSDDKEFDRFREAIAEHEVPMSTVKKGERFSIEGVEVEVLWPPRAERPTAASGNDDSVVVRMVYESRSVLLTGDIERGAEQALLRSGFDLSADILKVPHHGSNTSSTEALIEAVDPCLAVISVGERSRFGHPHASVVGRYLTRRTKVLQTGLDGMVTVETDGITLRARTVVNGQWSVVCKEE